MQKVYTAKRGLHTLHAHLCILTTQKCKISVYWLNLSAQMTPILLEQSLFLPHDPINIFLPLPTSRKVWSKLKYFSNMNIDEGHVSTNKTTPSLSVQHRSISKQPPPPVFQNKTMHWFPPLTLSFRSYLH